MRRWLLPWLLLFLCVGGSLEIGTLEDTEPTLTAPGTRLAAASSSESIP